MQLKGAGNMEEYRELAAAIPPFVRYVLTTLEAAGFEAYCVGGCVRDLLLRRTPGDWDMTTSARPEQTMALFGNCALPTGLKHGTVTVCSGMNRVETTTFRTDGAYADHRHPEQVTFTDSLQEDLSRRDFTVNAMAMELAGRLHDPFHGREDLKNGVLRCVGEPEKRFSEDALRILRCLRFAAVLDFTVERETAAAMENCRELLREIAPERVREELTKLLCGPSAAAVLRHFPQIVGTVLPEVLPMLGFEPAPLLRCLGAHIARDGGRATDTAAAVDGSVSRYGKAGMFCAGRKRNRTFHGTWRGIPPHCGGGDESPAL